MGGGRANLWPPTMLPGLDMVVVGVMVLVVDFGCAVDVKLMKLPMMDCKMCGPRRILYTPPSPSTGGWRSSMVVIATGSRLSVYFI